MQPARQLPSSEWAIKLDAIDPAIAASLDVREDQVVVTEDDRGNVLSYQVWRWVVHVSPVGFSSGEFSGGASDVSTQRKVKVMLQDAGFESRHYMKTVNTVSPFDPDQE
jgi:hypothetical protein